MTKKNEEFDAWEHLEDDFHVEENKRITHLLLCECNSQIHHIQVIYYDDWSETHLMIKLNHLSFWKRLKLGIKYILGKDLSNMNMYDEFIFSVDDIGKFEEMIKHLKKQKKIYERMRK